MERRTALDIKKEIVSRLKGKELSLRDLETKVNTNSKTIKTQVKELEYFRVIEIIRHDKSEANGRPFTSVRLIKQ
jgi:predicted transcriptional regulator